MNPRFRVLATALGVALAGGLTAAVVSRAETSAPACRSIGFRHWADRAFEVARG